jgi:hypothetical protein
MPVRAGATAAICCQGAAEPAERPLGPQLPGHTHYQCGSLAS